MTIEHEPRTWGYVRMSTAKQSDSPETQRAIQRKYADYHNLGDIRTFTDAATSAKIPLQDRQAGRELMRVVRKGDHVIIAKLDRMFRSLKDCVTVLDEFQSKGIRLHVCDMMGGALDLTSPIGRCTIHMLATFAELERAYISQRTKDGLAAKKVKNVQHARFPGYGFKWESQRVEGKLQKVKVKDVEERDVMRSIAMWRLKDDRYSWEEIAAHLEKQGVVTREGKPWDQNRVRRAFAAELDIQRKEAGGGK